jgi:hypothetical protein
MAGSAFVNSDPSEHYLQNNNDVVLIRLGLAEPGVYVVFGRVVILNMDGDAQNASARITAQDGADQVDRADVRLPGGSSQTIYLQGTARVDAGSPQIVDIRCSTFKGTASQSSLFAIHVDQLRYDWPERNSQDAQRVGEAALLVLPLRIIMNDYKGVQGVYARSKDLDSE